MRDLAQFFHIGNMDRGVNGLETAFVTFGGPSRFGDGPAPFYDDGVLRSIDTEDLALFAFVIASDDADLVAFLDVCLDGAHWENGFGN